MYRHSFIDYEAGNTELSFTLHFISKCQSVPLQFSLCQPAREEKCEVLLVEKKRENL